MDSKGWSRTALLAVVLSVVPGFLHLTPPRTELDRVGLGDSSPSQTVDLAQMVQPEGAPPPVEAVAAADSPPPASEVAGAVEITPPTAPLTGELAPAVPVVEPFREARASQRGEVYALVVGIDDYPGSAYDLSAGVADANTIDAALSQLGVPAANRVVLRNGQARRSHLVEAIRALAARAGPGSTMVFSFAGHVQKMGAGHEAIIAADGGYLHDHELASLLAPAAAESTWVVIAACYGGGFTEVLGPGRVLTAAADANSRAYESPELRGSFLVHHMMREGWLEGRAGPTVQEAFAYAESRIGQSYPQFRPYQSDRIGRPLRIAAPGYVAPVAPPVAADPAPQNPTSEPAPTTTTTLPPKKCLLALLCSRR